jgi:hypothetical protein
MTEDTVEDWQSFEAYREVMRKRFGKMWEFEKHIPHWKKYIGKDGKIVESTYSGELTQAGEEDEDMKVSDEESDVQGGVQ